jgi:hypothetical protein
MVLSFSIAFVKSAINAIVFLVEIAFEVLNFQL